MTGLNIIFDSKNLNFNVKMENNNVKNEPRVLMSEIDLKSAYAEFYRSYNSKYPKCE